jgi:alanine racemase
MAIVKANAYGHGAVEVVRALKKEGVKHFGVALVEEGITLRENGIKDNIYILSGISKGQEEEIIKYRFIPLISDIETAERFARAGRKLNKQVEVHLKVDTGMGRLGFLQYESEVFFKKLKKIKYINITGIASHFADLAGGEKNFAIEQIRVFNRVISEGIRNGFSFKYIHIANSAGIFLLRESHYDLVRPGIALYGYPPYPDFKEKLMPPLELKTEIIYIKHVPRGYSISYGRTFITKRDSLIATIPIGYADGLNRLLSNKGEVLIGGKRAPIAGRVCMDLTMVDVTGIDGVRTGDEVVIIGKQGKEHISALEIADKIGTITYEVLTSISSRVPRRYIF